MPEAPALANQAHAFLSSLLGQLLRRVDVDAIPDVLLATWRMSQLDKSLPSVENIKECIAAILKRFDRVYLILDNVGDYWDDGALPLWTVIMGPRFSNLSFLLTTRNYQNPSMTTKCSTCGKSELLVYWHCTTCNEGNFDACQECQDGGFGCQDTSHRSVLTDVQKEKFVVDIDSFYLDAELKQGFARRIDLGNMMLHRQNRTQAESDEALMDLYHEIFDDIFSNQREKSLIMTAISVVYYAARPLTVNEFLYALNSSQGPGVHLFSQIETVTGNLVVTNERADSDHAHVKFFNSSLESFLQRYEDRILFSGQQTMASICMRTLLGCDDFIGYASCHWGTHVRACLPDQALEEKVAEFLGSDVLFHDTLGIANQSQRPGEPFGLDFRDNITPLHICSLFGLVNVIERMHLTSDLINVPSRLKKWTAFIFASRMGHSDTLELLLALGADPYAVNSDGYTALGEAVRSNKVSSVQFFFGSQNLRPYTTITESCKHTALMQIQQLTSVHPIRMLLKRDDIDINECNLDGHTVLSHLFNEPTTRPSEATIEVAKLIFNNPRFNKEATDDLGRGYVQQLLSGANFDEALLLLLLDQGPDLEHRDHAGETAIFYAICWRPTTKAARILLKAGANINARNYSGEGLMNCIVSYYSESRTLHSVKALMKLKPELIDFRDRLGRTPLHKALINGELDLATEILNYRPRTTILDNFGRSAFEVACQYGRLSIIHRLNPARLDADELGNETTKGASVDLYRLPAGALESDQTMQRLEQAYSGTLPGWSLAYQGESL